MDNNNPHSFKKRLLRIFVFMAVLFLLMNVLQPGLSLPPEFDLQGMVGGGLLGGVIAAVIYRAWLEYKKKRDKK